ncbi:MAG: RnfABCDGE type electron transport complex subunit D [Spirochaetes bacterium]|nr:RnfABCDGE type electron transport complex subunit D [Spirochaetota bacterium]
MRREAFSVSGAPFISSRQTVRSISFTIVVTLVPVVLWSMFLFGPTTLAVIGTAVASAVAVEFAVGLARGGSTIHDGTAVLTGLFVGLGMPPGVPLFIPALATAFAIGIVKCCFGGLGSNWMNPALAGIAFAHANWPASMTAWVMPRLITGVEGISGATPLGFVRTAAGPGGVSAMNALKAGGYSGSALSRAATGFLNANFFDRLGARLPDGYMDLLLGIRPGCIGETAIIALLAGSVLLLVVKIIRWQIPATALLVFAALIRFFGDTGSSPFEGDVLFAISSGSVVLVLFYMATDPVTSPVSRRASIVYAAGIGALMFLFRRFGLYSEGTAFAVLIANCLVPVLEEVLPVRSRTRGTK